MKIKRVSLARSGFVMVMSLMILAIGLILVSGFLSRGTIHSAFDRTVIDDQKARALALSGVEIAKSLMYVAPAKKDEKKEPTEDPVKKMLERVVPYLNRWRIFDLTQKAEGIDATIKLCIMSEEGKININQLWDFEKKDFVGEDEKKEKLPGAPVVPGKSEKKETAREYMQRLFGDIKKHTKKDLFPSFVKFMKEREFKVNDVTELLRDSDFQAAFAQSVFYEPPQKSTGPERASGERPVFLTDLFTVFGNNPNLDPLLLSDSVLAALGAKRAESSDSSARIKEVAAVLKDSSNDVKKMWETGFKTMYGKEFSSLPDYLASHLARSAQPRFFSILVSAQVGKIVALLYAILEILQTGEGAEFKVRRLYWL